MGLNRRTWIGLVVADVAIWLIAEIQDSGGSLRTVFDVVWIASFLGFFLPIVLGVVALVRSRRQPAG